MGVFAPANVNGQPNELVVSVPDVVDKSLPPRFTPRLRAGYFYIQDRKYVLYGRKASSYLEDVTWFNYKLADQAIPGTERVWVKGIEVTGSGQYRFQGQNIHVNGASLTHPGVLVEEINYDVNFLDPIDLGSVLNPDDQVRVEYEYNEWVDAVFASESIVDPGNTFAGIVVTSTIPGFGGNNYNITINVSSGAGTGASAAVVSGTLYELDWFDSTTVQEVITALSQVGLPFAAVSDGNGTPATDLFSDLLTAAGIAPIHTFPLVGGVNASFQLQTQIEIFRIGDASPFYELPKLPANNLPVVMTDDRMERWDRRDIAPEFTVSKNREIEFNVPRNYVSNPDFQAGLELWMTSGAPVVAQSDGAFTLPRSYSAKQYIELPAGANSIAQMLPAFDEEEQVFSIVARGANATSFDVEFTFYDNTWTQVGNFTRSFQNNGDWQQFTATFGPDGRIRQYDEAAPADATYVLVEISPDGAELHLDYVHWGKGTLRPDPWQPHARVTVEYDVGDDVYYEHQPLLVYDHFGEPRANIMPLETCNTHGASNSKTDGFLYLYEYNDKPDFQLSLGGINAPIGDFYAPLDWPEADGNVTNIIRAPDGGFYVAGSFTTVGGHSTQGIAKIKANGQVDTDFAITTLTGVLSLSYDEVEDILYFGGSFTSVNGTTRNRMAAVDGSDGSLLPFNPNIDANVAEVLVDNLYLGGPKIYAGGLFSTVNGATTRNRIARFDSDGTVDAWDPDLDDSVFTLFLGPDRYVYAGGAFTTVGATSRNFLARWDADQTTAVVDPTFDPDVTGNSVQIVFQYDNILYIGGQFTAVSSTARNNAAAVSVLDGSLLGWDPDVTGSVRTLWRANEHIFMAGSFTAVGGQAVDNAAMVGIDGSVSNWKPEFDNIVDSLAVGSGVIAVGGTFTSVGTESVNRLAFFKYFDNKPVEGRRWVPYAKMEGLGKLRHVAHLRYNAEPWTREVTELTPRPISTNLEIVSAYGTVRNFVQQTPAAPFGTVVYPAGTDEITLTGVADLVSPGDHVYFPSKIDDSVNIFQITEFDPITGLAKLNKPMPVDVSSPADFNVEYKQMVGLVGQQRVIRLRLTDQFGAGVGQRRLTVVNEDPEVVQIDWDLPTNQDGEAAYLLTFLSSGTCRIRFSGSSEVTLRILVQDLAEPAIIEGDPIGPAACAGAFSTNASDWT